MATERVCSVADCGKPHVAKGYCDTHYWRLRRYGVVEHPLKSPRLCSIAGCDRKHASHGICQMHWRRLKRRGTTDKVRGAHTVCSVPGCGKPYVAKGFCSGHYDKSRRPDGRRSPERKRAAIAARRIFPVEEGITFIELAASSQTNDCIDWPWAKNELEYGRFAHDNKNEQVHRVICRRLHGEPVGLATDAAHRCGRRCCVNPQHIRWATPLENMLDKQIHGTQPMGETHPHAKLTEHQIREIRRTRGNYTKAEMARIYGVSTTTISSIYNGTTWRSVV